MRPPAGGYVCEIVKAENALTHKGKPKIMVYLNIVEGQYKGYYRRLYESRCGQEWGAKYPCVYHCLVNSPYFTELIKAIKASNDGCRVSANEITEDANALRRLLVGMVFGDVEYETRKGEISTIAQPRRPKSIEEIHGGKFRIPRIEKMSDRRRF